MLLIVLLQASTDVSGLISLYREVGAMLVGIGFICAGLSVLKPKSVIRISLCRTAKRNPLIFPI